MKSFKIIMIMVAIVAFAITSAFAEMPNTFTSGGMVKASEVNKNFKHVNYGNLVAVDGNGDVLGTLIGYKTIDYNTNVFIYNIINDKEYMFDMTFVRSTNQMGNIGRVIYYTTTTCTGSEYVDVSNKSVLWGFVVSGGAGLHYIPKTAATYKNLSVGSRLTSDDSCETFSTTLTTAMDSLINDPSITGVSSTSYTMPIVIKRR
jgi:hypothetical protein